MEIVVVGTVLLVLAVILGVDISVISSVIMLILSVSMLCIVGFFVVCAVRLAGSRRCEGRLSRIDKNPRYKFNSAFYTVDGVEYPNVFPCEIVMKKYLYDPEKTSRLRLDMKHGVVFDGNALACVAAGLILGTASLIMVCCITVDFMQGGII